MGEASDQGILSYLILSKLSYRLQLEMFEIILKIFRLCFYTLHISTVLFE